MEQRVGLNRGTLHTGERDVKVHSEGKSFMGRLHAHNEKVAFPSSIDLDVPRREDKRHRQKRFVASRRHVRVELAVVCCDPPLAWIPCKFGISSIASTTTNSNPSVASRGNTRPALLFVTPDCSASSQKMVETGPVLPTDRPASFVDVHSNSDSCPLDFWDHFSWCLASLDGADMFLPGGRYSCAQALCDRS